MTWADRLLRLTVGDPQRDVVEQLLTIHRGSAAQWQRLAAAATEAPTAAAESELRALSAQESQRADAIARALRERGAGPSAAQLADDSNGAARNHWGRLVAALEACRDGRANLVRKMPRLLELDPALADLLETLLRGLDAEVIDLRALIARADPQALN